MNIVISKGIVTITKYLSRYILCIYSDMVDRGGQFACGIDGGIPRLAVAFGFAKKVEV